MNARIDFDESAPGQGYDPSGEEAQTAKISDKTVQAYEALFLRAFRQGQARRWNGEIEYRYPLTYKEMAADLLENPRKLKYSTLFKIRSAMLHCMQGDSGDEVRGYMRTHDFMEKLKIAGGAGHAHSRPKGRHIPEDDFIKIINCLESGRGLAISTATFLRATIATGVRPIEWVTAVWEDRRNGKLRISSAKSKARNALNGSSFEDGRVFKEGEGATSSRIVNVEPEDINIVDEHILLVRKELNNSGTGFLFNEMPQELKEHCFAPYYLKCKTTLARASKKATGKLYSLYDARSTFAANRRARYGSSAADKELGHTTLKHNPRTASHYANTYKAWESYRQRRFSSVGDSMINENVETPIHIPVTFSIPNFKSNI